MTKGVMETLVAAAGSLAYAADALEADVSDELWPLPKYQEMLFIK